MKKLTIEETSNGYVVTQNEGNPCSEPIPYVFRTIDDLLMLVHIAKFMCKRDVKIEVK